MVHDPKRQPPIFELGVALQPGTETNLALKKTDVSGVIKTLLPTKVMGSYIIIV